MKRPYSLYFRPLWIYSERKFHLISLNSLAKGLLHLFCAESHCSFCSSPVNQVAKCIVIWYSPLCNLSGLIFSTATSNNIFWRRWINFKMISRRWRLRRRRLPSFGSRRSRRSRRRETRWKHWPTRTENWSSAKLTSLVLYFADLGWWGWAGLCSSRFFATFRISNHI